MKVRWALVAVIAATVGCSHMHKHNEEEEEDEKSEVKMTLDQVPPAVRATILTAAGGAVVGNVDKEENSKGQFTYETDVKSGGKNWEIRVAPDGTLISKKIDDEEDEKDEHK